MSGKNEMHYCSFCRKSQNEVRKLIAGPNDVFICDECIELCNDIIAEECDHDESLSSSSNVPKPAEVKRVVWKRDEGRCAFVGTHGRCTERGFLEVHHLIPFADGGEATVDNLQLRRRPQPTRGEVVVRRSRREYSERAATMNEQRRSRVDRSATAPP